MYLVFVRARACVGMPVFVTAVKLDAFTAEFVRGIPLVAEKRSRDKVYYNVFSGTPRREERGGGKVERREEWVAIH